MTTASGQPLRWRLEAAAVAAGASALGRLPAPAAQWAGSAAIRLAARWRPRSLRVARGNLELVFPAWSAERREALLADHLDALGRAAVVWARLPALRPVNLAAVCEFAGLEVLERALARGRGVIVATAHYGCWELLLPALRCRLAGREFTAVGHAQRNPALGGLIETRRRLGGGGATLPQAAGAVLGALQRGAAVGVLADHYLSPRRGGRLASFLGLRAWTNPGPATLALRAGCPLLAAHTRPGADGRQRVVLGPEIATECAGARASAIGGITDELNAVMGDWIRARPELWLWLHRRFRGSPDVAAARARERPGDGSRHGISGGR